MPCLACHFTNSRRPATSDTSARGPRYPKTHSTRSWSDSSAERFSASIARYWNRDGGARQGVILPAMQDAARLSPMFQQFQSLKGDHANAILFFRMGDF